jgi:hypothetical protein
MSESSNSNTATKIDRSENKLSNVLTKCEVTLAGQAWIDHALDLFKDSKGRPPCVGMPDSSNRSIVVQKYTATTSITRPASVPAGSNWDCHIINKQSNNVIQLAANTTLGDNSFRRDNPLVQGFWGGVMVHAGPVGVVQGNDTNIVANALGIPASFFAGPNSTRIIGKAHEVVNTTAMIELQGSVLVYQKPMTSPEKTTIVISQLDAADALVYGPLMAIKDDDGIPSAAQVLNFPKSRIWAAKDGVYQTCTLCSPDNPAGLDRQNSIFYDDGKRGAGFPLLSNFVVVAGTATCKSANIPTAGNPLMSPFDESGCIFQGLSSGSSLQLTATWLIETSPDRTNLTLNSLAHPSPGLDNCALELYSKIAHQLPAGVPVKDNAAGDWINMIADAAAAVGVPGAGLIKTGGKLLSNAIAFYKSDFGKMTMPNQTSNNGKQTVRNKTKTKPKQKTQTIVVQAPPKKTANIVAGRVLKMPQLPKKPKGKKKRAIKAYYP